jgi:hypothetical protein
VDGPNRQELFYDQIALTDKIRELDGCIIDCRYFDHQWIFTKQCFVFWFFGFFGFEKIKTIN